MPRFEPFPGIRYDTHRVMLDDVTAPPYDVIDPAERAALARRSPYNAVHIDCPVDHPNRDCYRDAGATMRSWQADGVLVEDPPSLYLYRMSSTDESGRRRRSTGVIGALGLEPPGEGDVLPHEATTPKARSDRLDLLRATAANLSPVWVLSLASGLSKLLDPAGVPALGSWSDADSVHHEVWRVDDDDTVRSIIDAVSSAPVVIADGHHRFETSLTYRDERRAAAHGAPGPYDLTLALAVELVDDELTVEPIHRLLSGLPPDDDIAVALMPWFELGPPVEPGPDLVEHLVAQRALALVTPAGARLLRPRPDAFADNLPDLDSARVAAAIAGLAPHEVAYQHGVANVVAAVHDGRADAGIVVRPATVAQIAAIANARDRMPPKTTFFWPKPRTGVVFRSLG